MPEIVFMITSARRRAPGEWIVEGRAYCDIRSGEYLAGTSAGMPTFLVKDIVTYGKRTDLLSKMMSGALIITGDDQSGSAIDQYLYSL